MALLWLTFVVCDTGGDFALFLAWPGSLDSPRLGRGSGSPWLQPRVVSVSLDGLVTSVFVLDPRSASAKVCLALLPRRPLTLRLLPPFGAAAICCCAVLASSATRSAILVGLGFALGVSHGRLSTLRAGLVRRTRLASDTLSATALDAPRFARAIPTRSPLLLALMSSAGEGGGVGAETGKRSELYKVRRRLFEMTMRASQPMESDGLGVGKLLLSAGPESGRTRDCSLQHRPFERVTTATYQGSSPVVYPGSWCEP